MSQSETLKEGRETVKQETAEPQPKGEGLSLTKKLCIQTLPGASEGVSRRELQVLHIPEFKSLEKATGLRSLHYRKYEAVLAK